jgi:protein-S-isoprenylcysteine O-methyltransferase Ste14
MTSQDEFTKGKLLFTIVYVLFYPALMFLLAGDVRWVECWVFSVWFVGICFGAVAWLYHNDPALLLERYRAPGTGKQRGWDVYVIYAIEVIFGAWIVFMPLDARRFHWSPALPLWLEAFGGMLLIIASYFLLRAFADNTFLSPLVRFQSERDHKVVSTGVYGVVRHPMYLGATALFIGAPILLGSLVGIAIGVCACFLLAGRIIGEEKMLRQELAGYTEYEARVRFRLIPHVW